MANAPEQIRAARALLRLEQVDLATRAHVSVQAGAEFIPGGVRRRPATQPDSALLEDLRAISQRSAARLHDDDDMLTDADLYDEAGLPA